MGVYRVHRNRAMFSVVPLHLHPHYTIQQLPYCSPNSPSLPGCQLLRCGWRSVSLAHYRGQARGESVYSMSSVPSALSVVYKGICHCHSVFTWSDYNLLLIFFLLLGSNGTLFHVCVMWIPAIELSNSPLPEGRLLHCCG